MKKAVRKEPFRVPLPEGVRETQATQVYHAIRAMILRCELRPGSIINDKALGEKLGYGRTPIREALLRLSSEQLVRFQAGQGIVVTPVDIDQINHLYTLRLHLERLAWRLWLEWADDTKIAEFGDVFDEVPALHDAGDVEGLLHLDFVFHAQIYNECGNPFLTQALYNLSGQTYRVWYVVNRRDVEAQTATALSHGPIIKAVKARDPKALDTEIEKHIRGAYVGIMDQFIVSTVDSVWDLPVETLPKRGVG